jgi:hypothetical protein
LFKLLAIGEVALLARKHLQKLPAADRRRIGELVRRGHRLSPAERDELRALLSRLEPSAFAGAALDRFSPVPLPRRFTRRR